MTIQQPQPSRDPAIASILEIVLGFGGLPGMGWIYADRIGTGLQILLGYWAFLFVLFGAYFVISVLTLGFGMILILCVLPIFLLVHFSLPFVSGKNVNDYLKQQNLYISSQSQANPINPTNYAPPHLRTEREMKEWVRATPTPQQNQPVIVQRQGFSGWQVAVIVILSIIAFVVFSCVALAVIGSVVGPPPG